MNDTRERPTVSAADMRRRMASELSQWARLGYVALLLVSAAGAGVVGALLLTEPALPLRTQVSFAALTAIGLSWAAFAWWVLTRRRVLLGRHRVVAGNMAVGFSLLFLVGFNAVADLPPDTDRAMTVVGGIMFAAAVGVLVLAHRNARALAVRRREIERQLSRPPA